MQDDIKPGAADTPAIHVQEAPPEVPHTRPEITSFKTPEQIAMNDQKTESATTPNQPVVSTHTPVLPPKKSLLSKVKSKWQSLSKKQKIIVVIVAILILGGGVTATALALHTSPKPIAKVPKKVVIVPPKPTTVASTLTGLPVAPEVNQRPVTGVMIENSTDARPQSGLEQAGVVFEAVAEGGITRFLSLFQDTQPSYIGPVRSVRPYYLQWCLGFDCAIAHVGGSPEALADIGTWHAKDLDQFANGNSYQRITSRFAPHNVYTSIAQLNTLETTKGFGVPKFTGFVRKADTPAKTPSANTIDLAISSVTFNVHYQYDPAHNYYLRSEGGQPHMQANAAGQQTQITPKVVGALVMTQGIEADDQHTSYGTIGSGPVSFFEDGGLITGTWHKADNNSQITFTDSNNQPIRLDAGQTWLTVVSAATAITYKP